jgi:putative peptidoglycan binding protein
MPKTVNASQGDCIASISYENGFFPDTIWNHEKNRELKDLRKNPNVIAPGDEVHIPDLTIEEMDKATEKRHRFRRKGVPEVLRVQFLIEGEPRADQECQVKLGGKTHDISTDAEGWIEVPIPPDAPKAIVTFKVGGKYELDLGKMDPVGTIPGVQKRLENLKMYHGKIDGKESAELNRAIMLFQRLHGLDPTGTMNSDTESKLEEEAG